MRYLAFRDGRQTLRFFMEKTWAVNFFLGPRPFGGTWREVTWS